jgi:hypothetical protein
VAIDPELGQHTVWLMERGGKRKVAQINDLERVQWGRIRDDISTAVINVNADISSPQARMLAGLRGSTGRYEICIWRGADRVWEGPITHVTYTRSGVVITARDVMHYASRTIMRSAYDNRYPNVGYVVERAREILVTELSRGWEAFTPAINVVPHIVAHQDPTDAQTSAYTVPYQYTVFEHVDNLAHRMGMDYTVLGRAIHLWDTSRAVFGSTPQMTEDDFLGGIEVSVYGMELATIVVSSDGRGSYGEAGEVDPYYGPVERLDTVYDEEATTAPTSSELASQAQRNLSGRNPTPLAVRVPDNSGLDLGGKFTIADLVPGRYVPLAMSLGVVRVAQKQKIQTLRVEENENGEVITVSLYPAADTEANVGA